jgi:hypothetical protein
LESAKGPGFSNRGIPRTQRGPKAGRPICRFPSVPGPGPSWRDTECAAAFHPRSSIRFLLWDRFGLARTRTARHLLVRKWALILTILSSPLLSVRVAAPTDHSPRPNRQGSAALACLWVVRTTCHGKQCVQVRTLNVLATSQRPPFPTVS